MTLKYNVLLGSAIALVLGAVPWAMAKDGIPAPADLGLGPVAAHSIPMSRAATPRLAGEGEATLGWLGFTVEDHNPAQALQYPSNGIRGAVVTNVLNDSPAMQAGLERGDIVVRFAGRPVATADDLREAVAATRPGATVSLVAFHRGEEEELEATVGQRDEEWLVVPGRHAVSTELGLTVEDLPAGLAKKLGYAEPWQGVVVKSVKPDSLAASAGIAPNDVILSIRNVPVQGGRQYQKLLGQHKLFGEGLRLAIRASNSTERDVYFQRPAT
jgi:serine protease Do